MKKNLLVFISLFTCLCLHAGVTTYTFTNANWKSKIDATVCDGTTDGWVCDLAASDYNAGRTYADGSLHSAGVSVKTGSTGAGATSVLAFDQVRRITFNFCLNASKGKGVIYVQVGENEPDSIAIHKPESGTGDLNRDSVVSYATPQSGKIKFWVKCTENAINIHTISIRSASPGAAFTMDSYQLVTDVEALEDSDQVIVGVPTEGVNYIMGYFDEYESKNNIHAITGKYSVDRNTVEADDRAIYTLRIVDFNGQKAFVFQDELRYEEAYLVASGGQTKNRLAVWTDIYDKNTYGYYGLWTIAIGSSNEAVITNLGNSKAKIIQYNSADNIFACYENRSQSDICLYRRVPATGDIPVIVAPFVNFGTTIDATGNRTIAVNANKLSEDISVSLKKGDIFSLSTDVLDRDGDNLTISYNAAEAGHYIDTLILRSDTIESRTAISLTRINPLTVAEAVSQEDYTVVYLKDVVVTKKYDNYIYVRDETGSMLVFDRGEEGKRYGSDVENGHTLSGVTGRMLNYYGVPEVSPNKAFSFNKNQHVTVDPEQAPVVIDSADVCRYLLLDSAVVNGWTELTYKGKTYAVNNKFNLSSFDTGVPTKTTVIVSYDYDVVTLYIVAQERYQQQGIDETGAQRKARLILRDGVVLVQTEEGLYTLTGERL